jgi:hypothetical protein
MPINGLSFIYIFEYGGITDQGQRGGWVCFNPDQGAKKTIRFSSCPAPGDRFPIALEEKALALALAPALAPASTARGLISC